MTKSPAPVVLVAGTAGTHAFWDVVADLLDTDHDLISITSIGDDLAAIARDVLAELQSLGLDRFHLVGDSLGAVVATQLAAEHPHTVESLLLINGWVHTDARMSAEFAWWDRLLATDPALFAQYLPLMAFGPGFWRAQTPESVATLSDEIAAVIRPRDIHRQIAVDQAVDIASLLPCVTAPTTVVAGRHDRLIPDTQTRQLVAGIADARLWVLDAGHGVVLEEPAAAVGAIRTHLDGVAAAPAGVTRTGRQWW